MLKKILIVVVVLLAVVLGLAAAKPDEFRVQRSTTIKAPAEKILPYFNDFHRWDVWSPWEKMDPAMKRTFGGTEKGKGSVYEWEGNDKVGKGRMEMTESSPSKVVIKLDFLKPFETHNTAQFTLEPQGGSTNVTWLMLGPAPFISKLIQVFCSMDAMVGKEFETGLANLKAAAEK